jgi:hypothetical protein
MYKLEAIVQQNTKYLNLPTCVKVQHRIFQNELRVVWSVFTEHGSFGNKNVRRNQGYNTRTDAIDLKIMA